MNVIVHSVLRCIQMLRLDSYQTQARRANVQNRYCNGRRQCDCRSRMLVVMLASCRIGSDCCILMRCCLCCMQNIKEDAVDLEFGYDRFSEGPARTGWMFNMRTVSSCDSGSTFVHMAYSVLWLLVYSCYGRPHTSTRMRSMSTAVWTCTSLNR